MAPHKFVIKCGNFAVLVDLHILPLGDREDVSWFTTDRIKEVTASVRHAVEQRVRQYTEFLQNRRHLKQKKDLPPASAFFAKEENFHLVANFLRRHSSLRCLGKPDLRVFPERYLVCVSCPEEALAQQRNPSVAAGEVSEQSRSEYFSRVGEVEELLNSSTRTKKITLQKIAKQANVRQDSCGMNEPRSCSESQTTNPKPRESETNTELITTSTSLSEVLAHNGTSQIHSCHSGNGRVESFADPVLLDGRRDTCKRRKLSDPGEDPDPQMAKRTCLGGPPVTIQTLSTDCSLQTAKHDLLPQIEANAESKAFPVSECKKPTLEVELLTPEKRAQRLPLTSNNAAQTNQNRLAASLRGLSVKPTSSCSSIGSRSTLTEERNENVPRTSRLRRLKRS